MLAGHLSVEAIKGVRGTRHRTVMPVELLRLKPEWSATRLTLGGQDQFVAVRVRRAAAANKFTWKDNKPTQGAVNNAMTTLATTYPAALTRPRRSYGASLKTWIGSTA